ncbi:MAG: HIT family protein [Candidatus Paceibacterota bacterium]
MPLAKSTKYTGPTAFVDIDNTREPEQVKVMEQIVESGECPFCLATIKKYHRTPILKETDHWLLTRNAWPYDNTREHFLIILKPHKERLSELSSEEGADFFRLMAWAEQEFDLPGGGLAMRFGDTNYSAGTIKHLHVQLIVPDIDKPGFKPARFKIGKG